MTKEEFIKVFEIGRVNIISNEFHFNVSVVIKRSHKTAYIFAINCEKEIFPDLEDKLNNEKIVDLGLAVYNEIIE